MSDASGPAPAPGDGAAQLAALADAYFDLELAADPFAATMLGVPGHDAEVPDLSAPAARRTREALLRLQERLRAVDPRPLGRQDRITHAMLGLACRDAVAELDAGRPEFTVTATGGGVQTEVIATVPKVTLRTAAQAADYLARCRRLDGYLAGAAERLAAGIAAGRTPSRHGVQAAIAQLDATLAGPVAADPLLAPDPPADVDADRWRAELAGVVADTVRPALRRYRQALAERVLPAARPDDRCGLAHLDGGEAIYRDLVRRHTTTELTPDEIHQLGRRLVADVGDELRALGAAALGEPDLAGVLARLRDDPALRFRSGAEILASAQAALDRASAALPDCVGRLPAAPCEVAEMSPFEMEDAVLGYYQQPTADGRPGIHWLNTSAPTTRTRYEYEALAFHESVPGHHLQFALALELDELPRFRRLGYVTAFSEGWALYAERLADELGLYSGDLARLGMLSFDAWRACRLVVDTGLHQRGWSRAQAIDYLLANTALTPTNCRNEVDRYIADPGQALAYMVGRLELVRLRRHARQRLGGRFDLRAFHDAVLATGGVPLAVLAGEVDRFVAEGGRPAGTGW